MRFVMFSMFDAKSAVFLQPFVARSENDARRQLALAFEDPNFRNTPAGRFIEEFHLYELGSFDDENGVITASHPRQVCTLASLKPAEPF